MSISIATVRIARDEERDYRPPFTAQWLARWSWRLLHALHWRVVLAQPVPSRCVIVIAPHTSNWDFVIGLLAKWVVGFPVRWIGKDSLFRWPFMRGFLLRIGGIPVDRSRHQGLTGQLREAFDQAPVLRLVIAPEGTRSRTEHWKSGFYHLALATRLPLGLAFIDYATREVGIGGYLALTGENAADMRAIAGFYAHCIGRHPQRQGPVRLHES